MQRLVALEPLGAGRALRAQSALGLQVHRHVLAQMASKLELARTVLAAEGALPLAVVLVVAQRHLGRAALQAAHALQELCKQKQLVRDDRRATCVWYGGGGATNIYSVQARGSFGQQDTRPKLELCWPTERPN